MSKDIPRPLLLPAILFIIYCGIFSYCHLLGVDIMEARNFVTAREIIAHGNWLMPTMNGELRIAKPPLPTWLTALAMKLAGSDANLIANRLPAGLAALLLLFFFYRFLLAYSASRQATLAALLVLVTSYMFMYMSRRGTWDMLSMTFAMGVIWSLYEAVNGARPRPAFFVIAGICAGLAFMSKGPVSLYTLLLPFLLSEFINGDLQKYLQHWKMLMLSLVFAMVVGGAWPAYLYFTVPEQINSIVLTEINSWSNRHLKSIFYYLQFPVTTGIWAFLTLPALWLSHSRQVTGKDFPTGKIVSWVFISLILLTVIPEKKDRYLLPTIIPLAALLGGYITALINQAGETGRPSMLLKSYNFLATLFLLATVASGLYYFSAYGFDFYIALVFIAGIAMLFLFGRILLAGQQPSLIHIILSFALMTQIVTPLVNRQLGPDDFMVFMKLRNNPVLATCKIYSEQIDIIKIIWATGKKVYQWNPGQPPDLQEGERILLLTPTADKATLSAATDHGYSISEVQGINMEGLHLFLVSKPNGNETHQY